jgi:flagellar biosynthesis anti-sigma factor FlgM
MVDAVSGGGKPITDLVKAAPSTDAQKVKATAIRPEARQMPTSETGVAGIARDMAQAAPVDTAKVETLRSQIASGSYKADPDRIADAMIRAEKGG